MLTTAPMKQLMAVVLDGATEKVTTELLRLGVLHLVKVTQLSGAVGGMVEDLKPAVPLERLRETRARIESFFHVVGDLPTMTRDMVGTEQKPLDLESVGERLDEIASGLDSIRERQRALQQEILKLEDIRRQIRLYEEIGSGIQAGSEYAFLSIRIGTISTDRVDSLDSALRSLPSVHLVVRQDADRASLVVITMKRDASRVDKALSASEWADMDLPDSAGDLKGAVLGDIDRKIVEKRGMQSRVGEEAAAFVRERRDSLSQMWQVLRVRELTNRIQSYFSKTSRTVLFTGWVPSSKQDVIERTILTAAAGKCYLEWHDPELGEERVSVPVQLRNPRFLAPFQKLVENYAIPAYGTIDPTPLVAVAYLAMFGMMFGDAGHGAVLILVGLLGAELRRRTGRPIPSILRLIVWCGCSAVLFGILFGSYFGMGWFEPLWFDFHGAVTGDSDQTGYVKDIYGILVITIYFGIAVLGLGIVLNWINLVRRREWIALIFDKAGLIGGWLYAAGVYVGYFFVQHSYRQLPPGGLLLGLLGAPVLLLFAKAPLEHRSKHRGQRLGVFTFIDFFMEWVVEILEVFSGYLANTLSFMRVAGLGIGHVSLMVAFFTIAEMLGTVAGGYTVWSYVALIFGNVLVIALEGLSAGIQSLRLNYYEFFSKYFSGSGVAYAPVSLDSRD